MRSLKALLGLAAVAAGVVSSAGTARADFVFDSTGGGGGTAISAFDPSPGNALAAGGVSAINNFNVGGPAANNVFTLYYQAVVGTLVKPDGTLLLPAGQLTAVASVKEVVTSLTAAGTIASFTVAPDQTGSFLRFYSNPTATANNLTGTGFTDGTQILSATPVPSSAGSGTFTTNAGAPVLFDQHGVDNYAGKLSTTGNGVSTIDFTVNSAAAGYFPGGVPSVIGLRFITSTSTPFVAIDPSGSFASLGGPAPNLGAVNGVSGPDFQFIADAFVTPVPEPSSVCLMGLGLAGVLAVARRKRAAQVA